MGYPARSPRPNRGWRRSRLILPFRKVRHPRKYVAESVVLPFFLNVGWLARFARTADRSVERHAVRASNACGRPRPGTSIRRIRENVVDSGNTGCGGR